MITYLGRVAPNKGHEYFIEALGRFPRSVQGRMVRGISDDVAESLLDLAEQFGCAGRGVRCGGRAGVVPTRRNRIPRPAERSKRDCELR
jgi:glycosyltransferase involved in cell wall biosynthesis